MCICTKIYTHLFYLKKNRSQILSPIMTSTSMRFSTSSSLRTLDFSGVYPPITTPFNKDETIAWDKLETNLSKMNNIPLRGYLVQGSNGEYCYLSAEERVEMIKKVHFLIRDTTENREHSNSFT